MKIWVGSWIWKVGDVVKQILTNITIYVLQMNYKYNWQSLVKYSQVDGIFKIPAMFVEVLYEI